MAQRLKGRFGYPEDEPFRVTWHEDRIYQPLKWRKPRKVFVVSMGDLFHPEVSDRNIRMVWYAMTDAPQHTYMILTKRPERMKEFIGSRTHYEPLPNVHLGVTVCNQKEADEKIPILLQIPAAHRFVSLEPLLSSVELADAWLEGDNICDGCFQSLSYTGTHEILHDIADRFPELCGHIIEQPGLDLVILGGESGPGARPMHPAWARSIRDQCVSAGVAFHMKQMSGRTSKERHMIPKDLMTKGVF
jgi:protein gp37